ncbi:MAG: serine--tRNA ligase, partial [Pseudomonadota bacterium]
MHDIRLIRDEPKAFDAAMARRGLPPIADKIVALDEERRALTTQLQKAQSRRNEASKAIGQAMGKGDTETAEALKAEVAELKQSMPELEEKDRAAADKLKTTLEALPNVLDPSVADGASEDDNVFLREWGEKPEFDFEPQEHADIAPA